MPEHLLHGLDVGAGGHGEAGGGVPQLVWCQATETSAFGCGSQNRGRKVNTWSPGALPAR
jgi:hypothetical protein